MCKQVAISVLGLVFLICTSMVSTLWSFYSLDALLGLGYEDQALCFIQGQTRLYIASAQPILSAFSWHNKYNRSKYYPNRSMLPDLKISSTYSTMKIKLRWPVSQVYDHIFLHPFSVLKCEIMLASKRIICIANLCLNAGILQWQLCIFHAMASSS